MGNQTQTSDLTGTRIFNRGDMANPEHFGTIVRVHVSKWGTDMEILPEDSPLYDEGQTYRVPLAMLNHVDKGHGGTRIVTEEAYLAHRRERLAAFGFTPNQEEA